MGVDEAVDDAAVIRPATDRSDTSTSLTSASDAQLTRQRRRRRRRGSDPEDIFNPQPGDDDEDTDDAGSHGSYDDDEALASGLGAARRQSQQSEEQRYRSRTTLDAHYLAATGSFLPLAFLIMRGLLEPQKVRLDKNTGAKAAHFAAHHGNLKFLRWLANFSRQRDDSSDKRDKQSNPLDVRDDYNCTLAHYSARQGHLPVVMYCCDGLNIDLDAKDTYDYSALDYCICYKRLYCFIYIYYCK